MIVHDSAWELVVKRERVSTMIDYHRLSSTVIDYRVPFERGLTVALLFGRRYFLFIF